MRGRAAIAAVLTAGLALAPAGAADAGKGKRPRKRSLVVRRHFALPRPVVAPLRPLAAAAPGAPALTPLTVALPTASDPAAAPAPSTPAALPSRTGVLLDEWRVTPARDPVAAGSVELDPTNYGEDAHDLTVASADGAVVAQTPVLDPGAAAVLTVTLPAGDYRLYCSLLDGAHDQAGMHATLRVR